MGVYLVPSSAVQFSVFPFCLTYCVCGLLFADCESIVPVIFLCLPTVGKVASVGCVGFLVEATGACILVDGAGGQSCLSGG